MDRVVQEAASLIEKGAGKVQMTLHPPSLGAVNMEVVVQNNRLELVLTAQHADVQQLLQANSEQLKNALSNQGFQVDQLSVLLKREGFGFNLGGNFQWQGGAGQQPGNANGSVVTASMPETEVMLPRRDYETGAISIFA
jgi:flagellar hook-length control protein FliK